MNFRPLRAQRIKTLCILYAIGNHTETNRSSASSVPSAFNRSQV